MNAKTISPVNSTSASDTPAVPPPTREQIQALAHAIWVDRGCPPGCDVEIWLEAERQLCVQTPIAPGPDYSLNESVDPDRAEAAEIERELDRIVSPPDRRSPTSL
jgi:hypothetical protein